MTRWPGCTANGHAGTGHVGDLDYSEGSPNWGYIGPRGDAMCSCCDPESGFPCRLDPSTPPGDQS